MQHSLTTTRPGKLLRRRRKASSGRSGRRGGLGSSRRTLRARRLPWKGRHSFFKLPCNFFLKKMRYPEQRSPFHGAAIDVFCGDISAIVPRRRGGRRGHRSAERDDYYYFGKHFARKYRVYFLGGLRALKSRPELGENMTFNARKMKLERGSFFGENTLCSSFPLFGGFLHAQKEERERAPPTKTGKNNGCRQTNARTVVINKYINFFDGPVKKWH